MKLSSNVCLYFMLATYFFCSSKSFAPSQVLNPEFVPEFIDHSKKKLIPQPANPGKILRVDLDRLSYRSETFTLATIESLPQKSVRPQALNPEFIPDITSGDLEAFEHALGSLILEKAAPWIDAVDTNAYPNISPTFFARKRALNPLNDGRSVMIVIFKNGNLNDIQATLKISYRNLENPSLPSDKLFPHSSDRHPNSSFVLTQRDPNQNRPESIQGSGLELGELAKKSKYDLLPVLWWVATRKGATEHTQPITIDNRGNLVWDKADRYELTCDKSMVPKYEALGFQLASPEPINGNNFKMYTNSAGFKNNIGGTLSKRVGMKMIQEGVFIANGAKLDFSKPFDQQDFDAIQRLFLTPDCRETLPKIAY